MRLPNKKLWEQENSSFSLSSQASGLPQGIQLCRQASTLSRLERQGCNTAPQRVTVWKCCLAFALQPPTPSSTEHLEDTLLLVGYSVKGGKYGSREWCSLLPPIIILESKEWKTVPPQPLTSYFLFNCLKPKREKLLSFTALSPVQLFLRWWWSSNNKKKIKTSVWIYQLQSFALCLVYFLVHPTLLYSHKQNP